MMKLKREKIICLLSNFLDKGYVIRDSLFRVFRLFWKANRTRRDKSLFKTWSEFGDLAKAAVAAAAPVDP